MTTPLRIRPRAISDEEALDALATHLGTSESWNGGDVCSMLATLIAATGRPHPGDAETDYAHDFPAITGRPLIEGYRQDRD